MYFEHSRGLSLYVMYNIILCSAQRVSGCMRLQRRRLSVCIGRHERRLVRIQTVGRALSVWCWQCWAIDSSECPALVLVRRRAPLARVAPEFARTARRRRRRHSLALARPLWRYESFTGYALRIKARVHETSVLLHLHTCTLRIVRDSLSGVLFIVRLTSGLETDGVQKFALLLIHQIFLRKLIY